MKALASSLVKAQRAFAPALKQSQNPHFKSRYVDLAGCVEAVIDALNTNGIFLMQPTRQCDDGVMVETVFLHESGEQLLAGSFHVPATKQDAQGYGSALTYARRYSLMAACGIAPEDDDGNAASRSAPAPSTKADPQAAAMAKKVAACKDVDSLNELFASIEDQKLRQKMAPTFKARKGEILGVTQ
jgi:hypothetical protein